MMSTPTTQWISDNGTVLEESTAVFADESENLLIDESGLYLLDSLSTSGDPLAHSWQSIDENETAWSEVLGNNLPTESATRVTAQGDTRTTAQNGDTRVTSESNPNIAALTSWSQDEY